MQELSCCCVMSYAIYGLTREFCPFWTINKSQKVWRIDFIEDQASRMATSPWPLGTCAHPVEWLPASLAAELRYSQPTYMTMRSLLLLLLLLLPCASRGQMAGITIPEGTPLPVKIGDRLPMKAGEPIRAELIYPVYVGETVVLPAHSVITGTVVSLRPDRTRRIHARLRADFTPFHVPVVRFDHIVLADGRSVALTTGTATDGAPIYRLVAPAPHKGGVIARGFSAIAQGVKDRVATITSPGLGDRVTQLLWSQLPYHPERIAKDTAWTVETGAPVELSSAAPPVAAPAPVAAAQPVPPRSTEPAATWIVQAYLNDSISSASAKAGQTIHATVAQPIFNADGSVAVPVGSVMSGSISRAGTLRFSFRDLRLPGEEPVAVQAALTGADSATGGNLEMTSEGEVKQKPQDKVIVPFILLALARGPLRHHRHGEFGADAVASNSIGLIGFVVGTAAQQPFAAAGIGYYGAAISIYERFFRRGKEVAFARDTRVVIQTTARRSSAMKPAAAGL
jgi:hypothetical protein